MRIATIAALLLAPTGAAPAIAGAAAPDFAGEVLPILAARCFKCHGPDAGSRRAKLRLDDPRVAFAPRGDDPAAVVPGDADASALIARILDPGSGRMPPEGALPAAEIAVLRAWIESGAEYRSHPLFVAPQRPTPPAVAADAAVRHPIDRFILARLASEGLEPAPEADRARLLRRLHLDLTGLPPTPEEVDDFVADAAPGAWERRVDALLASPRFAEQWAAPWLDLARYADTKGYEADRRRTIWPWRDWVIEAIDDDLPFDEFTIRQLAGDLLPDADDRTRLATAFHRNTMTNDEGGTDDEEYRVAAVLDRVDTTMQAWTGLTAGCAKCHAHKYDPISHREYYALAAFFNQSEDADRMDEAPLLAVPSPRQRARRAALEQGIEAATAELDRIADSAAASPERGEGEAAWIDDLLPPGATAITDGAGTTFPWRDEDAAVGGRRWSLEATGLRQVQVVDPWIPLTVRAGDRIEVMLRVDPARPPRLVAVQLRDAAHSWEHRAWWGEDLLPWGTSGTPSRAFAGPLPEPGGWTRLVVDPATVGLAPGAAITAVAFTQVDGVVAWDAFAVTGGGPRPEEIGDAGAWARAVDPQRLPESIRGAVLRPEAERDDADRAAIARFHRRHVDPATRRLLEPHAGALAALERELAALDAAVPQVPVMRELPDDRRRRTHVLAGGNYLAPTEEVVADVPAFLPPLPEDAPRDRLGLAAWLVDPAHPLVARVAVNRWWQQIFGTGLVETSDDFGVMGEPRSHPDLLDWLATELVRLDWSRKALLRTIVTSATYRRSAAATPEQRERDPRNRLLARAPRLRLPAETVRDAALAVAGLLDDRIGGPPVFPPQPEGVWMLVYNDDRWTESPAPDRWRRSIYTFWRRTAPHPAMTLFDAPSREVCTSRRIGTNTPLQALAGLNDPALLECALGLARRVRAEAAPDESARAIRAMRLCVARRPEPAEIAQVRDLVASERERFLADPGAARALLDAAGAVHLGIAPADDAEAADLAAWTIAGSVLLNLDEFLTRG